MQHINVWISGDDAALTPPAQKRAAIQPGVTPEFKQEMLHCHDAGVKLGVGQREKNVAKRIWIGG